MLRQNFTLSLIKRTVCVPYETYSVQTRIQQYYGACEFAMLCLFHRLLLVFEAISDKLSIHTEPGRRRRRELWEPVSVIFRVCEGTGRSGGRRRPQRTFHTPTLAWAKIYIAQWVPRAIDARYGLEPFLMLKLIIKLDQETQYVYQKAISHHILAI